MDYKQKLCEAIDREIERLKLEKMALAFGGHNYGNGNLELAEIERYRIKVYGEEYTPSRYMKDEMEFMGDKWEGLL